MEEYNPPIITEDDDGMRASPFSVIVVVLVIFAVAILNQGLTVSNYSTHTTYYS